MTGDVHGAVTFLKYPQGDLGVIHWTSCVTQEIDYLVEGRKTERRESGWEWTVGVRKEVERKRQKHLRGDDTRGLT